MQLQTRFLTQWLITPVMFIATVLALPWISVAAPLSLEVDANESPPFWSSSPSDQGMCNAIVQAMSKAANIQTTIHFKPLSRMIEDDQNNDLGNPVFFMQNQEFAAIIPIAVYHVSIFSYKSSRVNIANISTLTDLKGYKLGILKGTLINRQDFKRAGIHFEESYSQASLFKKLQKGRIDLVIETNLVGHAIINELFPESAHLFAGHIIPGSEAPIAILLADSQPNAKVISQRLRQGLQSIRESGEYKTILQKYYTDEKVPSHFIPELERFSTIYKLKDM